MLIGKERQLIDARIAAIKGHCKDKQVGLAAMVYESGYGASSFAIHDIDHSIDGVVFVRPLVELIEAEEVRILPDSGFLLSAPSFTIGDDFSKVDI